MVLLGSDKLRTISAPGGVRRPLSSACPIDSILLSEIPAAVDGDRAAASGRDGLEQTTIRTHPRWKPLSLGLHLFGVVV